MVRYGIVVMVRQEGNAWRVGNEVIGKSYSKQCPPV